MKFLKDKARGHYHYYMWVNGKQKHRRGFNTLAEAKADHHKLQTEVNSGIRDGEITFSEFVAVWLPKHIRKSSKGTPLSMRATVSMKAYLKHLEGFFGNMKLKNIIAGDVDDFVDQQIQKGLALATVRHHFRALNLVLKNAVKRGHVIKNVVQECDSPKPPPKTNEQRELMVYNIEEQTKLRAEVKKDVDDPALSNRATPFMRQLRYMYVELMLSTGLRISEAMGLQWKDIVATTEKREGKFLYVLHVHRSIEVDGTYKSTKTSRDRRVPLSFELTEMLFAHKKFLAEYSKYYDFKDNGLVFPKDDGEVYLSRNMANSFRDLLKRIGLHGGSHTMRHTAITNWLSGSKNIKLAQTLAGHANIAMTLDTYGHVLEENVMDSIDDLYKTMELTKP